MGKIKKALKGIIIVLVAGGVLLGAGFGFVYYMDNEPMPLSMLDTADGNILVRGNVNKPSGYHVRITNNSDVAVRSIKFRIDFLNVAGNPIDGAEIFVRESMPAKSTRTVKMGIYSIGTLPSGWTYKIEMVEAWKASPFEYWF